MIFSEGWSMTFPHLRYFLKGGDKVVVTDDGQSVEHVDSLEREWRDTYAICLIFKLNYVAPLCNVCCS